MVVGLLPYAVKFLTMPIYMRFLSPSDYGLISLIDALNSFILPFVNLRIGSSLIRYYFDFDEKTMKRFFSTILFAILGINLLLFLMLHFGGPVLTGLLFKNTPQLTYSPYVFYGILATIFSGIASYFLLFLRVQERGWTVLLISLGNVAATVALGMYYVVYRKQGASGMLLSQMLSALIYMFLFLPIVGRYIRPVFDFNLLKKAFAYGLPIIPHSLGRVIFVFSDRIILGFFVPVAMVGLYGIADRFARLLGVTQEAFQNANDPNFMRMSKESKTHAVEVYRGLIAKWLVAFVFLYLGLVFFIEDIIVLVTPEEYHNAYVFVPILMASYIFRGLTNFNCTAIFYEKKTGYIPVISFSAGLANILLNLLLIPKYGIMAAAWTTLFSYILTYILSMHFSKRCYPLRYAWSDMIQAAVLGLGVFVAVRSVVGSCLWLNALIKIGGMALFALLVLIGNVAKCREDVRQLYAALQRRIRS